MKIKLNEVLTELDGTKIDGYEICFVVNEKGEFLTSEGKRIQNSIKDGEPLTVKKALVNSLIAYDREAKLDYGQKADLSELIFDIQGAKKDLDISNDKIEKFIKKAIVTSNAIIFYQLNKLLK